MSEISEAIEKAEEGEHAEFFNKRIALVIAILALFLSFSETLGKGAQNEANTCLLYTSPSPRDPKTSRMPSSA